MFGSVFLFIVARNHIAESKNILLFDENGYQLKISQANQPSGAIATSHKADSIFSNYLLTKIIPIAIPWFGISPCFLGISNFAAQGSAFELHLKYSQLVEWPVLAATTVGAILGAVAYLSLAGIVAKKSDKYRGWYMQDIAQEIISLILNVAIAAVYSKMFVSSYAYFLTGLVLVGFCYGAWRSFCFKD